MMKYRDTEYALVRGVERDTWKWSASVAGVVITGEESARSSAAAAAERAIDRALSSLKMGFPLRAEPNDRLNSFAISKHYCAGWRQSLRGTLPRRGPG
jgi:hypothetical protein